MASRTLREILDQFKVDAPPIAMKTGARVLFAQPILIVDVEYRAWTADGKLRHPAYKGLSEQQDNATICRVDASVDL